MKKDTRIVMLRVSLLTVVSSSYLEARQNQKMANTDSELLDFEELKYPALARMARITGAVIIRAKLDDQGKVVGAETVSGAAPLARRPKG